MNNLKNEQAFIKELISAFPEIKNEILDEDYAGLISLQIGCFKRFTQKAIDNNDLDVVKKSFQFVEANIGTVEHKIENALYISYLGKLNIVKNSKVEKLLPDSLKRALFELNAYNTSGSKNEKLNKFLNDL
jgi:hypothetical protein